MISNHQKTLKIVLASGSKYKQQVLSKLGLAFHATAPKIDESRLEGESAEQLVSRLALEKAMAIQKRSGNKLTTAADTGDTYYIGVDQVATFDNDILGKPHTVENAMAQLQRFSGQRVEFLTGVSLLRESGQDLELLSKTTVERFYVKFRPLSHAQISHYVEVERPLDCAGAFKSEGVGILLFESLEGRDINALVGMPLMALREMFAEFGVDLLLQLPVQH